MKRWLRRTLGVPELSAKIDEKFTALETRLDLMRASAGEPDQSVLQRFERLELQIGALQVEISSLRVDLAREMEMLHNGQIKPKT